MAVTVTKSATAITVTGTDPGGNTIDELCTAIGDTAYMERTGSNPYTYTIKQGSGVQYGRVLTINNNCRINMTNPGDTLVWINGTSTTNSNALVVAAGGTFYVNGNDITIDMGGTVNFTRSSLQIAGSLIMLGSAGHEVIVKNWGSYLLPYNYQGVGELTLEYVKFVDTTYVGGSIYVGYNNNTYRTASFKHFTFEQVSFPVTNCGTFNFSGVIGHLMTFEDVTLQNVGSFQFAYGESVKFKDSLFSKIDSSYPRVYGLPVTGGTNQYNAAGGGNVYDHFNQIQPTFDGCIFESNYYSNANKNGFFSIAYNALVKFKDCTFRKEASSSLYRGIYEIGYGGVVVFIGTNTFTDYSNNKWYKSSLGRVLFGKEVTIRVLDSESNPIENASVRIVQSEGKETWNWLTSSDGYVKDAFGDDCYLIEKEDTSTYGIGTYVQWSDSISGGRYHTMIVSSPGYGEETVEFELASTTSFTITLKPLANIKRKTESGWETVGGVKIL